MLLYTKVFPRGDNINNTVIYLSTIPHQFETFLYFLNFTHDVIKYPGETLIFAWMNQHAEILSAAKVILYTSINHILCGIKEDF